MIITCKYNYEERVQFTYDDGREIVGAIVSVLTYETREPIYAITWMMDDWQAHVSWIDESKLSPAPFVEMEML